MRLGTLFPMNFPLANAVVMCAPSCPVMVSPYLLLERRGNVKLHISHVSSVLDGVSPRTGSESRKMTARTLPARCCCLHLKSASGRYVNKIYLIATSTSELDSCNIQYLGALHVANELARIFIS